MTLQLENYGVSELSHSEQRETDGGFVQFALGVVASLVATVAYEIVRDWEGSVASFKQGQADHHKK